MINALLKGLMSILQTIVNIVLAPINLLIGSIFPDLSSAISTFTNFCNTYIGGSMGWFTSFLPPITKNIIVIWLTFLISYYSVVWSYHGITSIWKVIQKLKFW